MADRRSYFRNCRQRTNCGYFRTFRLPLSSLSASEVHLICAIWLISAARRLRNVQILIWFSWY